MKTWVSKDQCERPRNTCLLLLLRDFIVMVLIISKRRKASSETKRYRNHADKVQSHLMVDDRRNAKFNAQQPALITKYPSLNHHMEVCNCYILIL
jgi:hypothetical protein